jgi:catechol 2,3-dioxygenase-like lactoylglutathione lyase family enzyme
MPAALIRAAIPVVGVADIDATSRFYARLGFAERNRYPDYAIYSRDGFELHVWLDPQVEPETTGYSAYFRVANADALHHEFSSRGVEEWSSEQQHERIRSGRPVELMTTPETQPHGVREFAVYDCVNNRLRFGQSPS